MIATAGAVAGPSPLLLAILSIVAAGGGLSVLYQIFMRWRHGQQQDEDLVSRISGQVAEGAHALLEDYRVELRAAQRQIETYVHQVVDLNRILGEANARIGRLERSLDRETKRANDVEEELKHLRERREQLLSQIAHLRERIAELESEVHGKPN